MNRCKPVKACTWLTVVPTGVGGAEAEGVCWEERGVFEGLGGGKACLCGVGAESGWGCGAVFWLAAVATSTLPAPLPPFSSQGLINTQPPDMHQTYPARGAGGQAGRQSRPVLVDVVL